MVMERTNDEIIIRFPADGNENEIQEMVNYLNFKQIKTKKEINTIIDLDKDSSLEEMLSKVTQSNLHTEIETYQSVGNEVW